MNPPTPIFPDRVLPANQLLTGFRCVVIVLSDRASQGIYKDESGNILVSLLKQAQAITPEPLLLPDGIEPLATVLRNMTDKPGIDLILTTGGTGFSPRDLTPEATRMVIERFAPGIDEVLRHAGSKHTPLAYASRAVSGIRNQTLIINLSGSPKAVQEQFDILLNMLAHCLRVMLNKI